MVMACNAAAHGVESQAFGRGCHWAPHRVAVQSGVRSQPFGGPMSLFQEVPRIRVIGNSEATRRVEREALLAARGDANVLITGERGVGKAVVARFIHESSGRS